MLSPKLRNFGYCALLLAMIAAPFVLYPVFVMKVLCFALFASAFNLLIGFTGLVSFGHATFFGGAAYICGYALTALNCRQNLAYCSAQQVVPSSDCVWARWRSVDRVFTSQ